ncbi:MAG: valine--pyruvate transaminase [Gammaproteobacteria bacterium]
MRLSLFGHRFTQASGILRLMEDLGQALAVNKSMLMLGGGNPAHIPEVECVLKASMQNILDAPGGLGRVIGDYSPPQGNPEFIEAVADLLCREYGWNVGPRNVALTGGSQCAFFMLFNMFAGAAEDGRNKKILLPMCPEYIGYSNLGLAPDFFAAAPPSMELIDKHTFKYHVDMDCIAWSDEIGAICVSRPTNPTGNVLTESEMQALIKLAKAQDIPLIVDSAYGAPFPNILFSEAETVWDESVILTLSLSKFGLPGARTGIVIAREEVIDAIARINAIINLAPVNVGSALMLELFRSGEVLRLGREVIKPYYECKAREAVAQLSDELDAYPFLLHKPEGAIFLWLWFKDLPITSEILYQRLKDRGVLVVPGHYFFPGMGAETQQGRECIRITYAQAQEVVEQGLAIVADEVRKAYND